ncbi:MAG: tetratricopeptide repeat protein [Bacteroidales bacterium]|nr:tetratricopeptide repeat protein [Bacteroidales bacterium]
MKLFLSKKPFLIYGFILFICVFIVFANTLGHDFLTNWDDQENVINNDFVLNTQTKDIYEAFIPRFSDNEYQPLTLLYFWLIAKLFGIGPAAFHFFNILLHAFNTVVLFLFFSRFIKELKISFLSALIFAVHPMQSEVVAWVSAANYLLFTFFSLGVLMNFNYFLSGKERFKMVYYILACLLFLLSLLSKSTAAFLPLVLLGLVLYHKKMNFKTIVKLIPFFLLSFLFVLLALKMKSDTLETIPYNFSLIDKPFVASFIFLIYIFKIILPFNLSALYDYPLKEDGFLPIYFYFSIIVMFAVLFFIYKIREKKLILLFFLFFTASILPVLHLIPYYHVGFYADRYAYFGIGGFSFGILCFLYEKLKNVKPRRNLIIAVLVYVIIISGLSFNRNEIFANNITFFKSITDKQTRNIIANYRLAQSYEMINQYGNSLRYYNAAIENNTFYVKSLFMGRGLVLYKLKDFQNAQKDFSKVLEHEPYDRDALMNRGLSNVMMNDYDKALNDFSLILETDPNNASALVNRGGVYLNTGDAPNAIFDFDKSISLDSNNASLYYNRALAYEQVMNVDLALIDYNRSINLNPQFFEAYNSRAVLKGRFLDDIDGAYEDVLRALEIKPDMQNALGNKAYINFLRGDTIAACNDWKNLSEMGNQNALSLFNQNCN